MTHKAADFLFELGCEELPAKGLKALSENLGRAIQQGLEKAGIPYKAIKLYVTPRRLSFIIQDLAAQQSDQYIERRGPAFTKAYDPQQQPTPATLGFARSCNVDIAYLEILETAEGKWLVYRATEPGKPISELLPDLIRQALVDLPCPRLMRWGDKEQAFLRPVQWLVAIYADAILPMQLFGINAGRESLGHRNNPSPLTITNSKAYEETLAKQGKVIVGFEQRRKDILQQINHLCQENQAKAIIPEDLLDEVTGLVEWPSALCVSFEKRFLEIPAEVLITAMQNHQKCFAITDAQGKLLPYFITIANLESKQPASVIKGNERVMRARLSDAAFFYHTDLKQSLASRLPQLKQVIFQKQLGSLFDKSQRIGAIAKNLASISQIDPLLAERAGLLAKADLNTTMVNEFPELQGVMGTYYAQHDGEMKEVAIAIGEHYLPRFASDDLPQSNLGCVIALADRLDTLIGLFGIQQIPRSDKDPFGLRRCALGIVRILIERHLDFDLASLIQLTHASYGKLLAKSEEISTGLVPFIQERYRSWAMEQGYSYDEFNAVIARQPTRLYDSLLRLQAVKAFRHLATAQALAAAHKRVNNLLTKAEPATLTKVIDPALFESPAEDDLYKAVQAQLEKITPWYQQARYTEILTSLATMQKPVDEFFNTVMVMDERLALRQNRLALLTKLRDLFLYVADISQLQIS